MLEQTILFAESWNVAWRKKKSGSIFTDTETTFNIIKNSIRYWASDPFVFEYNNEVYVFAELYDYVKCRGILGYCKLEDGKKTKWTPIIEEGYHMSYPYIFLQGKEIFIIPETNESDKLYLYQAIEFPNKWEKYKIIRTGVKYADTTPFILNGRNCALTYQVEDPYHPKLYLLDFEQPENDQQVPVDNIDRRRPAGAVLQHEGRWIRPAQNCVSDYGKGLIFYSYEDQMEQNYTEKEWKTLFPEQLHFSKAIYLDGMHTYNCSGNYEVIDIKTRRLNLINLFFRFLGKIRGRIKR